MWIKHDSNCSSILLMPGGSGWFSIWHPGLSVRGAVPELADLGTAMEGLHQALMRRAVPLRLRPAALDR